MYMCVKIIVQLREKALWLHLQLVLCTSTMSINLHSSRNHQDTDN